MEHNESTDKQRQNKGWENIEPYKFKLGESGNPNGRPKKADCLTSLLKEEIEKLCPFKKAEQIKKLGYVVVLHFMSTKMLGGTCHFVSELMFKYERYLKNE